MQLVLYYKDVSLANTSSGRQDKGWGLYRVLQRIFFTKSSKVLEITIMHGDTVRCTQNTFLLRFLKGPILHFRPLVFPCALITFDRAALDLANFVTL